VGCWAGAVAGLKRGDLRTELGEMLAKQEQPLPARAEDIRVLHLGKFLEDHKSLADYHAGRGSENPITVHISVKSPSNKLDDVKDRLNRKGTCACSIM